MLRFILRRALYAIPSLFGLLIFTFLLIRVTLCLDRSHRRNRTAV